jgi:hypothetical protein
MYTITAYIIYLFCSIITVFIVGNILHRNGKMFLFGECPDRALSDSANNFLYKSFCMVNTAFALFFLGTTKGLQSLQQVLEFIFHTQGIIFLSLGSAHLINLLIVPKVINHFLNKKLLTPKN